MTPGTDAGVLSPAVTPDGQPAPEFGYHGPDAGCPVYRVPGTGAPVWLLRSRASVLAALRSPAIRDLAAVTPAHALAGVTLQRSGGLLRRTSPGADTLRAVLNPVWRRAACEPYRPALQRQAAGLPAAEVHEAVTTIYNGIPTTAPALARIVADLLERPGVLAACQAAPALARPIVAEALRRAAHFTFALPGRTRSPVVLDGTEIPAGAAVLPVIHAAEHDPTPHAGRSGLGRPSRATLAWGAGVHACLGRHLAIIALEEAVTALARTPIRPPPGPLHWQPGTLPAPAALAVQT